MLQIDHIQRLLASKWYQDCCYERETHTRREDLQPDRRSTALSTLLLKSTVHRPTGRPSMHVNDDMTFFLFTTSSQLDHDARCTMFSWTRWGDRVQFTVISGSLPPKIILVADDSLLCFMLSNGHTGSPYNGQTTKWRACRLGLYIFCFVLFSFFSYSFINIIGSSTTSLLKNKP